MNQVQKGIKWIMETKQLTDSDHADLVRLEKIVDENMISWIQVGLALREIRDRKLYLARNESFEEYVKARFDVARSTAYQYLAGVDVIDNVKGAEADVVVLPEKESLVRPLTRLEPDEQTRGWQLAIHRAHDLGEETVLARHVVWAVQTMRGGPGGEKLRNRIKNVMEELPETFRDAFRSITESIYAAKRNRFVGIDRKKMLEMLDGLKRLIEG